MSTPTPDTPQVLLEHHLKALRLARSSRVLVVASSQVHSRFTGTGSKLLYW